MSVDCPLEISPVDGTEDFLVDLADFGHGQMVDHLDRLRRVVRTLSRPDTRDQRDGVGHSTGAGDDERLDRLAPLRVGYADHRGLGYRGVVSEYVFDLTWVDVEAAGDDHVLFPVHDVEEAGLAAECHVAGA